MRTPRASCGSNFSIRCSDADVDAWYRIQKSASSAEARIDCFGWWNESFIRSPNNQIQRLSTCAFNVSDVCRWYRIQQSALSAEARLDYFGWWNESFIRSAKNQIQRLSTNVISDANVDAWYRIQQSAAH